MTTVSTMLTRAKSSKARMIFALAGARLMLNITRRYAHPFLPEISRILDVPFSRVSQAVAVQGGVGMLSPLLYQGTRRYGQKRVLLGALAIMAVSALPGIFFPVYGVFFAAMAGFGLAKVLFDPTMQAYVSERVPYHQRGLAIGFTELAWAGSLFIAAPLTGFLLTGGSLRSVFMMLLLAALIALGLLWRYLPADEPISSAAAPMPGRHQWSLLLRDRPAVAGLLFSFFIVIANEAVFIAYGAWMEQTFQLKLTTLGAVTIVIALAEVVGEIAVTAIADRVGTRRLTLIGALFSALGYALLPLSAFSLIAVMLVLFYTFVCIEAAIVSSITLLTEVLPQARALLLSSNAAAHAMGRFSGALLGGLLYRLGGFELNVAVAVALGAVATLLLWRFVREASLHPAAPG